jgi:anti-sigma regulatory factor (Ser/Thr protein kinase)
MHRVFPARMDVFPEVAAFVDELAAAAALERDDGLRLRLCVEELFTNTVRHGHGGESDEPVTVSAAIRPGEVTLTYEDTAPPHDPTTAVLPDPDHLAEQRRIGGLGVLLIRTFAEDLAYTRAGGANRITFVVRGVRS